jgi:hypothetical protein
MERLTRFFKSVGGLLTGLAAVVGGAAALFVASAGDGGSRTSTHPPTQPVAVTLEAGSGSTIDDWRTAADDICRTAHARVRQLGRASTPDQLLAWVQAFAPITSSSASRLRALERPAAESKAIEEFLAIVDRQYDAVTRAIDAGQVGDLVTFQDAIREHDDLGITGNRMAADLGLDECSQDQ